MFLTIVSPENRSMQDYLPLAPLKARKSHPNMMVDPMIPLPMMIIKFIFYCYADAILPLLAILSCYLSCFMSQSSLLMVKNPKAAEK
jgi:hypothetical protein